MLYTLKGNDIIIALGENTDLQGDEGNDNYHVTLNNNTKITDASGTNKLYIHAFDNDGKEATFAMNVDRYGDIDLNGIVIMGYDHFNNWAENGCEFTEGHGGIHLLSGTGTVSEIYNAYEGSKVMYSSDLDALKTEVVTWLNSANNGDGYADVATALQSGEADDLRAIFTNYSSNDAHWHDIV